MTHIGVYKGVHYHRRRICDVMAVDLKSEYYFLLEDGSYTGDHFRTLDEMRRYIDALPQHQDKDCSQDRSGKTAEAIA